MPADNLKPEGKYVIYNCSGADYFVADWVGVRDDDGWLDSYPPRHSHRGDPGSNHLRPKTIVKGSVDFTF